MRQATLFADTQVLVYAFERKDPRALQLLAALLRSDGHLVASEETLLEFAQSESLERALHLTNSLEGMRPVWLRNFADIETEELVCFIQSAMLGRSVSRPAAMCESFQDVSRFAEARKLDPRAIVTLGFDRRMKREFQDLHAQHARVVDHLTTAAKSGLLSREVKLRALIEGIRLRLSRGSDRLQSIDVHLLDTSARFCAKHRSRMMRECPSFAVEYHLSDYRSSAPGRLARLSDSRDLTLASAAFPYVDCFLTNDGYLHGALTYIKKKLPFLATELLPLSILRVNGRVDR